jgi:nucleoside-diphosphate-sugar epimerase
MLKPKILVTGATGKTGSLVVAELLKAGYPVRAMVHREDARSGRLKALGLSSWARKTWPRQSAVPSGDRSVSCRRLLGCS